MLAAASSDGSISIITRQPDGTWSTEKVRLRAAAYWTHYCEVLCRINITRTCSAGQRTPTGCHGRLLGSSNAAGLARLCDGPQPARQALCLFWLRSHCQGTPLLYKFGWVRYGLHSVAVYKSCELQVWRSAEGQGWQMEGPALTQHSDWVRDVAWAPSLGLPASTLASAGQDGRVFIWSETAPGAWSPTLLHDFQVPCLKCGLSAINMLLQLLCLHRCQCSG